MKKDSKLLIFIITVVVFAMILIVSTFAEIYAGNCGAQGDNVTYRLDTEIGLLEISGTGAMTNAIYDIPWASYTNFVKTIIISNGVTSIGDFAFNDCRNLTSVTIPSSTTSIGYSAFGCCGNLTSVTIPASVKRIGHFAFKSCNSLTAIKVDEHNEYYCDIDGVLYSKNKKTLVAYPAGGVATYSIPDSVNSIGESAFSYGSSIGSVTIPASVKRIGSFAFRSCSSLTAIKVDEHNEYYCDIDGVLYSKNKEILVAYPAGGAATYSIPDSVNSIGEYAFSYGSSIGSVTIPNSVTSIGDHAFYHCSSLADVIIPNSVMSIGDSAFGWCSRLTSITIPDSIANIKNSVFSHCSSLTSVFIPDSVTSIGGSAFSGCSSLASVTIPDSVTSIGYSAFEDCSSLTSVTILDSVTSIGDEAFSGCSSLTSVTIPDSVTSVGDRAFSDCSSLMSVAIPDSVTSIGGSAFFGCSSLTSVTIPDSVTSIGERTFAYCHNLTSIIFPDSVTSIGDSAFGWCSRLTSVTIHNCEAFIDFYAFEHSFALTIRGYKNSTAEKYAKSRNITFVAFTIADYTNDGNELRWPLYDEATFCKILRDWIETSGYSELFNGYLKTHAYNDLLDMNINMPIFTDNGKGIILDGSANVRQCMGYILFVEEAQEYLDKVNSKVLEYINAGQRNNAYEYFLKELKNFQLRFYYFQEYVNGKDTFSSTLNQLILARMALSAVDMLKVTFTTGEVKYVNLNKEGLTAEEYKNKYSDSISHTIPLSSYHYVTDMYSAAVTESSELYDDVMYYIMSGGDDKYLNKNYQTTLRGVGLLLKNSQTIFEVLTTENSDLSDSVENLIGISLENITYFAEKSNLPYADRIISAKKYWESANTAYDFVKAVCNVSLGGVVTSAISLTKEYIETMVNVFNKASNAEAGWYALMFYHLGKTDERLLKQVINPDTGAAYIDLSIVNWFSYSGNDPITKALKYSWSNKLNLEHLTTPDENYRMYLLKTSREMINIESVDSDEMKSILLQYLLAEINRREGNMGVYFDVNAKSCDDTLGKIIGNNHVSFGEEVVLTAIPYTNCSFAGWVDADTGNMLSHSETYTFTAAKSVNVVANFVAGEVETATTPNIYYDFCDAQYYVGDIAKGLSVTASTNDSGTITISWYRNTKKSTSSGTFVGNGKTFTPSTEKSGTYYYYAVVKNTLKYTVGTQTTTTIAQKTTEIVKIDVYVPFVISVEITNVPSKIIYYVGDVFDAQGMTLTVTWSNKAITVEDNFAVSYDFSSTGVKTVTVGFEDVTDEFYVVVFDTELMKFEGYQVRETDYNGLRSRFIVDLEAISTLENSGFEIVEIGTIFAFTDNLTESGDEFIIAKGEDGTYKTVSYGVTVPVMKNGALVGKYISKTEDELVFACTITNFNSENYNKNVSSRGYAVLSDADGNEYVVYCDYEFEEYRSVSLEMICDALFEAGEISTDNISYTHVVAFRKED